MWDDRTGTAWSHLDGRALDGRLAGTQLRVLPLQTTTWAAWVADHPATTVPSLQTGFSYSRRVDIGGPGLSRAFLESLPELDRRLPVNELVIGVLAGDQAVAFPLRRRDETAPMQARVGGVSVVILEDADGVPALAFHRALTDGRVLDFTRRGGAIVDVQTGSRWNAGGRAVDGPLAGVQLAFVTSFLTEWYGWAAFHPATTIYGS